MIKRYPFVKQEGLKDCGPASLAMIIKYYKGYVPIEIIRKVTKTDNNGTNAYNLLLGANKLGFEAKGIKTDLNSVSQNKITLPAIAHLVIDNKYKHYVVIYDINIKNNYLVIGDPETKVKKIDFDDFVYMWDGVLIIMYPSKPLLKYEERNVYDLIWLIINKYKTDFIKLIFLSLTITFLGIINAFYFKSIMNAINYSKNYIIAIFIIFLIINIFKIISDFMRNKLLVYLTQKIDLSLTIDTYNQLISLPYHYFYTRTTGEVISRLNDLGEIKKVFNKLVINFFIDIPLTFVLGIILFIINKTLFTISFIVLLLYLILSYIYNKFYKKKVEKVKSNKADISSFMVESLSGIKTIKGINIETQVKNIFETKYVKGLNSYYKMDMMITKEYFFKDILQAVSNVILIFIGSLLILNKIMTTFDLITYTFLCSYFFNPIKSLSELNLNIKEAENAYMRISSIFIKEGRSGFIKKKIVGNIKINNLSYSYDNKTEILKNITVDIKAGSKIMVVGSSGSGKSTFLKLLKNYYEVERNKIYIDDIDINDYTVNHLSKSISYLGQDETLFTGTLYDNLNIGNKDKLLEIINLCHIDEIISNSSLGLNMIIEENGYNLSSGQRQRVSLGRMLLKSFTVLLLDEALSAVDPEKERKIIKNIFSKYKDKTIIMVSHHLENKDLFDEILEIKEGFMKRKIYE